MHCGQGRAPRRSRSLASRYLRRVLNYLRKLQGQRRAARVKAKRKATMFAHAVEKTTQGTRQEKRPASLRAFRYSAPIYRGKENAFSFLGALGRALAASAFSNIFSAKGATFTAQPGAAPQDSQNKHT